LSFILIHAQNGVTRDGVVVVWHDESIIAEKCVDTAPVTPGDPDWPYVGKFVANLTWAQLRTLDCGSKRVSSYRECPVSTAKSVFLIAFEQLFS
jgi:glycerophosphoryl diester phosphodiesterase